MRRPHDGVVSPDNAVFGAPIRGSSRPSDRLLKVTWSHDREADLLTDQVDSSQMSAGEHCTDFYEFYWAYRFRDTGWSHLRSWLLPLLRRQRRNIDSPAILGPRWPKRAALLTLSFVALLTAITLLIPITAARSLPCLTVIAAAALFVLLLVIALVVSSLCGLLSMARFALLTITVLLVSTAILLFWRGIADAGTLLSALGTAVSGAAAIATGLMLRSLGDAARYFDNTPDNVSDIGAIQREAVDLLLRLESAVTITGEYKYDRVVVVGHSLGSVIAYDAIRFAWSTTNRAVRVPSDPESAGGVMVRSVEKAAYALVSADRTGEDPTGAFAKYRQAQARLSDYLRFTSPADNVYGRRWIVTDFISVGSPLTYADVLQASSPTDLRRQLETRVVAAAPPVPQRTSADDYRLRVRGAGRTSTEFLHQAAPFAATRWTNIYYPHDLVGGPVCGRFGPGIRDVALPGSSLPPPWGFVLRYPHSSYWNDSQGTTSVRLLRGLIRRPPTLLVEGDDGELPGDASGEWDIDGLPVRVAHGSVTSRRVRFTFGPSTGVVPWDAATGMLNRREGQLLLSKSPIGSGSDVVDDA